MLEAWIGMVFQGSNGPIAQPFDVPLRAFTPAEEGEGSPSEQRLELELLIIDCLRRPLFGGPLVDDRRLPF